MWVGALLQLGGTAMNMYGQYQAGKATQRANNYNASIMDQKAALADQGAELVEEAATWEVERAHKGARRLKASQVAAYSQSGAMISEGTPLTVMVEQAADMERDILVNRRNRMIEAQARRNQGTLMRSEADMMRASGKYAYQAGITNAAAAGVGGAASIYGSYLNRGGSGEMSLKDRRNTMSQQDYNIYVSSISKG